MISGGPDPSGPIDQPHRVIRHELPPPAPSFDYRGPLGWSAAIPHDQVPAEPVETKASLRREAFVAST